MKTFFGGLKKYLTIMAFGALAGVALAGWVGPGILHWWSTPPTVPGGAQPMISCEGTVQWALNRLVQTIAISALLFAIVFAIAGALISKARGNKPAQLPPAKQPVPPAGTTPQV